MSETEPQSPCISVCLLDDDDICVGCFRSADEITEWFMADAAGKRDILKRCGERRESASTIRFS